MLMTSLFHLRPWLALWHPRAVLCRWLDCDADPLQLRTAAAKRRLEHALQAEGLSKAAAVRVIARLCRGAGRG